MLKKSTIILLAIILSITISASTSIATLITLDGTANAVLWSEDKTKPYLNVWDVTNNNYYYQWKYGDPGSLQWGGMNELTAHLYLQDGLSWRLESGGDPFNPVTPIWKSISLTQGTYEISLAEGSSAYNMIDYWGGDMWNAYVQIWTDHGDSFNFGEGSLDFNSKNNALAYYNLYVDGMIIDLQQDTELYLYINDGNSVDNSGSVTLNIETTPVPEPSTVILLAFGMLSLFIWRHKQNKNRAATQTA